MTHRSSLSLSTIHSINHTSQNFKSNVAILHISDLITSHFSHCLCLRFSPSTCLTFLWLNFEKYIVLRNSAARALQTSKEIKKREGRRMIANKAEHFSSPRYSIFCIALCSVCVSLAHLSRMHDKLDDLQTNVTDFCFAAYFNHGAHYLGIGKF